MAVKALRAAAVLTAALSLGSCQVLDFVFQSVFPATVALLKAQADLSGQIPATNSGAFNVRVVESPPYGYVVVMGPQQGTSYSIAYFFDLDLNPKQTQTLLPLNSGIMIDAMGYIVIGSQQLKPADLSLVATLPAFVSINSGINNGQSGIDGFISSSNNMVQLSVSGNTFNFTGYNSSWSPFTGTTPPVISTLSSLQMDAVLDDGGSNITFAISPTGGGNGVTTYFLTIPKSNFPSALAGLLDSSPHRDDLNMQSLGIVHGSILAYDTGSSRFIRIDPATGSTQSSFYLGTDLGNHQSHIRYAYQASGGSFYGFDTETRMLTKYAAWW